jgi:hypothetical protein
MQERAMAVDWVMLVSWGPLTNSGDSQPNYWRVPFSGAPHILASAYLGAVSTGTLNDVAGVAIAAFKRFEFLDANGNIQEQEVAQPQSGLEVENCVSITVVLELTAAAAIGGWSFFFVS